MDSKVMDKLIELVIEKTSKKAVGVVPTKSDNLDIFSSKMGGLPYIPKDMDVPRDVEGNKLALLIQINLDEVKNLEDFPTYGMLQIYIGTDDLYGVNFDELNNPNGCKVIYHSKIDRTVTEEEVRSKYDLKKKDIDTPFINNEVEKGVAIKFDKPISYPGGSDSEVYAAYLQARDDLDIRENFDEVYSEFADEYIDELCDLDIPDILLGGNPEFAQEDVRSDDKYKEYTKLLLKVDTLLPEENKYLGIMWGDMGVANFFIKPQDLKDKNFSDILYTWDSY